MMFSAIIADAFINEKTGIEFRYHTESNIFNLQHLKPKETHQHSTQWNHENWQENIGFER